MASERETFWQSLMRAYADLYITYDEAVAAMRKWDDERAGHTSKGEEVDRG